VRYFAAQGYGTVIVAGPAARAAAVGASGESGRTRIEVRAAVPR
jgi:hypothetical protein